MAKNGGFQYLSGQKTAVRPEKDLFDATVAVRYKTRLNPPIIWRWKSLAGQYLN
jgi:hypothetical protein